MQYLLKSRPGELDVNNELDDSWLGLKNIHSIAVEYNPMLDQINDPIFDKNPGLFETYMLRKPEYLSYFTMSVIDIKLPPIQQVILSELWNHSFPLLCFCRGGSKSSSLALYSLLKCLLIPDYKVVIAGASFRQSKMIFEYVENLWNKSPILRSMCNKKSGPSKNLDKWTFRINDSEITAIPIGPTGDKVRGFRANTVIADEIQSHNPQILEEVIFGFGAVQSNPMDAMKLVSRQKRIKEMDLNIYSGATNAQLNVYQNQSIISGTADYHFNHYYSYWQRYCNIIKHKGNIEKLAAEGIRFEREEDYKKYCVMRIPWRLIPEGFMSEDVILRQKSQMSVTLFNKEYEAIFVADSDGFFKRSLIESCVASEKNILSGTIPPEFCSSPYEPIIRGIPGRTYVMGVDPAFKEDNFAIVILEILENHSRVVYSWITNEEDYSSRKKHKFLSIDNYYGFCANHIRELLKTFNCEIIAIDAQGGGEALKEVLGSKSMLEPGELPILPLIEKDKPKPTDKMSGIHILSLIQFANYNWTSSSNHQLLSDIESRRLIFPAYDTLTSEISIEQDKQRIEILKMNNPGIDVKSIRLYDSLEDVALEIEELKNELTSIMCTQTSTSTGSRLKWYVPERLVDGHSKVPGKKDRYCALLMANHAAKLVINKVQKINYSGIGGSLYSKSDLEEVKNMYSGTSNFALQYNQVAKNFGAL